MYIYTHVNDALEVYLHIIHKSRKHWRGTSADFDVIRTCIPSTTPIPIRTVHEALFILRFPQKKSAKLLMSFFLHGVHM